mmetsp:Transcript_36895/g.86202  ORF Transcript_36895/g.86202 Transcript_36895/m.86202 type:complete len:244 (-) Transcript_36895:198-929(-)
MSPRERTRSFRRMVTARARTSKTLGSSTYRSARTSAGHSHAPASAGAGVASASPRRGAATATAKTRVPSRRARTGPSISVIAGRARAVPVKSVQTMTIARTRRASRTTVEMASPKKKRKVLKATRARKTAIARLPNGVWTSTMEVEVINTVTGKATSINLGYASKQPTWGIAKQTMRETGGSATVLSAASATCRSTASRTRPTRWSRTPFSRSRRCQVREGSSRRACRARQEVLQVQVGATAG